jgi:hypothetical protein
MKRMKNGEREDEKEMKEGMLEVGGGEKKRKQLKQQ